MRSVWQIYEDYRIMPNLREHQLRVAAVGNFICDKLTVPVNTKQVVETCLFHDMGNIIKFDLSYFPEFNEPAGRDYWEEVKREYIKKYGGEARDGNFLIAKELKLDSKVVDGIDKIGFSKLSETLDKGTIEDKICGYADMRVTPSGVASIDERLSDGTKRYLNKKGSFVIPEYNAHVDALREIERQISSLAKISPADINDQSVSEYISMLLDYQIA